MAGHKDGSSPRAPLPEGCEPYLSLPSNGLSYYVKASQWGRRKCSPAVAFALALSCLMHAMLALVARKSRVLNPITLSHPSSTSIERELHAPHCPYEERKQGREPSSDARGTHRPLAARQIWHLPNTLMHPARPPFRLQHPSPALSCTANPSFVASRAHSRAPLFALHCISPLLPPSLLCPASHATC